MATLLCRKCKEEMTLNEYHGTSTRIRNVSDPKDTVKGFIECGKCRTRNPFEYMSDAFTFVPGDLALGSLTTSAPPMVRELFAEAETCFYSGAARGAAAMCRASVEEMLNSKNITARTLEDQIDMAKTQGLLGDLEHSMAHGCRLVGNNAVHKSATVQLGQIPPLLTNTILIINKLG